MSTEDRLLRLENAMATLAEVAAKANTRMDRSDERMTKLEDLVMRLAKVTTKGFEDVSAKINALVDSQMHLLEAYERLTKSQGKTDDNLRNLIAVVDRYFKGRNGES